MVIKTNYIVQYYVDTVGEFCVSVINEMFRAHTVVCDI